MKTAINLITVPGHPLSTLSEECREISVLLKRAEQVLTSGNEAGLLSEVPVRSAVTAHNSKKGDLIYPLLKERCPDPGPLNALWDTDTDIKNELIVLEEMGSALTGFSGRLRSVLQREREAVQQENETVYPLCAQYFSDEDWIRIYKEMDEYEDLLSKSRMRWEQAETALADAEKRKAEAGAQSASQPSVSIPLGSGHMTPEQIEGVLNTVPMELSFIDDRDINCYFNAGKKLFRRPDMAIGREVYACHPPSYETLVDQTIDKLRSGEQESADVWLSKGGEPVLVRYMAVRGRTGKFLGTLECVQKMGFAEEYFRG